MLTLIRTFGKRCAKCTINMHITRWNRKSISTSVSCLFSMESEAKSAANNKTVSIVNKLKCAFNEEIKNGHVIPVYKKALLYGTNLAIKDHQGEYSYMQLYQAAKQLSYQISNVCESGSSSRIVFVTDNSALYTVIQWSCWISGQTGTYIFSRVSFYVTYVYILLLLFLISAVPLSCKTPANLLAYYIKDSKATVLITVPAFEETLIPLGHAHDCPVIVVDHSFIDTKPTDEHAVDKEVAFQMGDKMYIEGTQENSFYSQSDAMVLYTSGSTGQPKGTLITHRNIQAQVDSLHLAWKMTANDTLLHVLPLNHVHGCVNALILPLAIGAKVVMLPRFDSASVWSALLNVNAPTKDRITVFMGVPTMYSFLISEYEKKFSSNSRMIDFIRTQCSKRIRLMISGSAPLPNSVFTRWAEITGHKLLERYGMTEIGMALSNPYHMDKARERLPGTVGAPLPGVEVKLVDEGVTLCYAKGEADRGFWSDHEQPHYDSQNKPDTPVVGELYIKGPSVFKQYLDRPDETDRSFVNDWFATGDEAQFENGIFSVLGRKSVDIIKTGGHKVSALEIETQIMEHPDVQDVCVVGVADITWGQRIAALVVPKESHAETFSMDALREFCRSHLEAHQVPVDVQVLTEIPRNAMGKVNKKHIVRDFFGDPNGGD